MRAQGACRQRCQPWFVTAPELQPSPLLFRVPFRVNSSRWELQGPQCVQRMIPDFSAPLWEWNCAGITLGSAPPRAHLALPCPLPSFIQDVDFLLRFHPAPSPGDSPKPSLQLPPAGFRIFRPRPDIPAVHPQHSLGTRRRSWIFRVSSVTFRMFPSVTDGNFGSCQVTSRERTAKNLLEQAQEGDPAGNVIPGNGLGWKGP